MSESGGPNRPHIGSSRCDFAVHRSLKPRLIGRGNRVDVGPSARYNGHVGAGGAEVVKTNLFASNGIVHVVDRVIQ